jgi:hypothetical protein
MPVPIEMPRSPMCGIIGLVPSEPQGMRNHPRQTGGAGFGWVTIGWESTGGLMAVLPEEVEAVINRKPAVRMSSVRSRGNPLVLVLFVHLEHQEESLIVQALSAGSRCTGGLLPRRTPCSGSSLESRWRHGRPQNKFPRRVSQARGRRGGCLPPPAAVRQSRDARPEGGWPKGAARRTPWAADGLAGIAPRS